jgi:AcrR family transcriptional regulator
VPDSPPADPKPGPSPASPGPSSDPDGTDESEPRPQATTRWGDREGRRSDILEAARAQMNEHGYSGLNMRDIARRASVSAGSLYSYFDTKEEIFAILYAEAISVHNEDLVPICEQATDLESLIVRLTKAYIVLYAGYGRYFSQWSAVVTEEDSDEKPLPREVSQALRKATLAQGRLIGRALRRVAGEQGVKLVDEQMVLPFLWTMFTGIAEHLLSERRRIGLQADELIDYAARTIARGLVQPT